MNVSQCKGGYPMPIQVGKMEIAGICMPVDSLSSPARLTVVDTDEFKEVTDSMYNKTIIDLKGIANVDGMLQWFPKEPVKVNYGFAIADSTNNYVSGRILVYVR